MITLLDDVRNGRRRLSTLSGQEFQQLIFERLLDILSAESSIEKVENHSRGAVDYIAYERPGAFSKQRKHYFECKNYSRTLELDNVAKVMVVAVAEQPDSINIVSRTSLQPQIRDYAAQLFDIGGVKDRRFTPIFQTITFRHWQTDQLADLHLSILGEEKCACSPLITSEASHEIFWWLTQCAAFSETLIASSDRPDQPLYLPLGCRCLLTVETPWQPVDLPVLVGLPAGCWHPRSGDSPEKRGAFKYSVVIDTTSLKQGEYLYWLKLIHQGVDITFRLPKIHVISSDTPVLPELRGEEIAQMVRLLGPSSKKRLVLVEGEAGVGKTHFIENMATNLRTSFGFDVSCFTISPESRDTLLRDLLLNCLMPPVGKGSFQDVAEAVRRRLIDDDSNGFSYEAYVSHLIRIVVQTGARVLVLRDCQNLNEPLANQLWALIQALDDTGWGSFRLILEYRQPDANRNSACMSLIERIRCQIHNVLTEKKLKPLTNFQMEALTSRLFASITPDINKCLFVRTGGLPLFIDSYLNRLMSFGFIKQENNGVHAYAITEPAKILADTIPFSGALILEDRIRMWLDTHFGTGADKVVIELGILAVANGGARQALVRRALKLTEADLHTMRRAIEVGDIGYGQDEGVIVFRHDMLRTAMISVAMKHPNFSSFALELVKSITDKEVQAFALRADIFAVAGDQMAFEIELRRGAEAAYNASDYGWQVVFLSHLVTLLSERGNSAADLLLPMSGLAWAEWTSGSILIARECYQKLANLAQQVAIGQDFSHAEAIATDAYRRIAGLNLDLMEPLSFTQTVQTVLVRRPDPISFNSILNRLVLYCARFGYPALGYDFAQLGFQFIGDGRTENQGAVLCSDMGMLYVLSEPSEALALFRQGVELAGDTRQRVHNQLDILITECLNRGGDLNQELFEQIWNVSSRNRFSGISTRASLFRGALCMRDGDIDNAHRWLERAQAGVNLYHMKFLEPYLLNDLLAFALMENDYERARRHFRALAEKLEAIMSQREAVAAWLPKFLPRCQDAAQKLSQNSSLIRRPTVPPRYCNRFADLIKNISTAAEILDINDIVERFNTAPDKEQDVRPIIVTSRHYVQILGREFALGAH